MCGLTHQPSDSAQKGRGLLLTSEAVCQSRVAPLCRRQEHGGVHLLGNAGKWTVMTASPKDCGGTGKVLEFSRGRGVGCRHWWTWDFFPFSFF